MRCSTILLVALPWLPLTAQADEAAADFPLREASRELGVSFRHETGARGAFFMPEIFGSGAALFDLDGDGDLDLLAVDGGVHGRTTSGSGETFSSSEASGDAPRGPEHRLWRQGADGRFTEIEETGLDGGGIEQGYGMGVAVGDIDGDGLEDLFISAYGGAALYRNRGDGSFENVTVAAGLASDEEESAAWSTSALFFDYDDDRDLDLFVVRYLRYVPPLACSDQAGRRDYCGPGTFAPSLDRLWRNDGEGRFTEVGETAGLDLPGKGLGVVAADFDDDGRLDLYVANDGEANRLWLQEEPGRFVDRALEKGVAVDALGRPEAGMGVALGDVDVDGLQDLLVSHLRTETNTLYLADAEIGFLDATVSSGVGGPSLPRTGFGTVFADLDVDGDLDLLVTNGAVTRNPHPAPSGDAFTRDYAQAGLAFENLGDGRFRGVRAGDFTATPSVGRALVQGDIDDDGDVDLVQTSSGGLIRVFLNETVNEKSGDKAGAAWARVELRGASAEHASVSLEAGGVTQTRLLARGQGYLSSHDPRLHFALGGSASPAPALRTSDAARIDRLEVRFRSGAVARFSSLPVNRRFLITEPDTEPDSEPPADGRAGASGE